MLVHVDVAKREDIRPRDLIVTYVQVSAPPLAWEITSESNRVIDER